MYFEYRKNSPFVNLIFLICFIAATSSIAQDSHYWNLQYGTRSHLLGGAVIGSVTVSIL
jgi:hypothetical protein